MCVFARVLTTPQAPDSYPDPLPPWTTGVYACVPRPACTSLRDFACVAVQRTQPPAAIARLPVEVIENLLRFHPRNVALHVQMALHRRIDWRLVSEVRR